MTCPKCSDGELLFEPYDYENGDPATPYYEFGHAMGFVEEERDCACTFTDAEITQLQRDAYEGWQDRIVEAQAGVW